MNAIVRRRPMDIFGDLGDWIEMFPTLPVGHMFRVEDYMDDGKCIVRAELPGMDPDRDITITVANGILTIGAERKEGVRERRHTEFRYGTFHRSVALPAGTDEEKVVARYENGILEVTIPITKEAENVRHVPVARS